MPEFFASLMIPSEKLRSQKKETLRPVSSVPAAVVEKVEEITGHFSNIGVNITTDGLFTDNDLFAWKLSLYIKGKHDGTYYLFLTAEGELHEPFHLNDSE